MKELVLWLINLEHTACEIYQQAAKCFQENKHLSTFLDKMSEDEAWHYHVMSSAKEYLDRPEMSIEAAIEVDEATDVRIKNLLQKSRSILDQNHIDTAKILEAIIEAEFSEWNDIFLYVINVLKKHSKEFQFCASLMESHKNSIIEFIKSQPDGESLLPTILKVPGIWEEKILIVDDDPAIVDLLEAVFEQKTLVETATNGEEAFNLITSKHFDAVVTDIHMPELDGINLYKKAVVVDPSLKDRVLFFSGAIDNATEKFISQNDLSFLQKPASIEEIEAQVLTIIKNRNDI